MKKRYRHRKELKKLAAEMGLIDEPILAETLDQVTKKKINQLVNNVRRFVRGTLKLPLDRQLDNINKLRGALAEKALEDAKKEPTNEST